MAVKSKSATQIYFNKDHEMVRKAVREFVDKEINPNMDEWEEKGEAPLHDLFKKMGDLGFLGIRYDPKYGGQGLDYWYDTVFLEELGRVRGSGIPMAIAVQSHMATPAIQEFGSEHLKETYLAPAIAGKMVASIAVTEPGAGSDVSALQTTAKKDGDSYIINGSKTYITSGTQADFLTLLARTSDAPGYHSFSLFVFPPGCPVSRSAANLKKWDATAVIRPNCFLTTCESRLKISSVKKARDSSIRCSSFNTSVFQPSRCVIFRPKRQLR